LYVAGEPWLTEYLRNNGLLLADHGGAIIRGSDEMLQFVNLQYLGHMLFQDSRTANLMALAIAAGLSLAWLMLLPRRDQQRSALVELSALAVISLLPIYHRVYDAGVLLLPLCWIIVDFDARTVWHRRIALLLLLPFFVPGVTFLVRQIEAGRIPEWLTGQWWWNVFVMPHQVWALTLMALVLLAALARTEGRALRDSL
jgi:hypothetical protein